MDKIEQRLHRRSRLIQLIDGLFGGRQADFAAAAKKNPTQVNHWISGHRNPNGDTCRDVEKELGLPNNWFDSTTPLEEIFQTTLSPSDGSGAFLRTASEYLANQTTHVRNSEFSFRGFPLDCKIYLSLLLLLWFIFDKVLLYRNKASFGAI